MLNVVATQAELEYRQLQLIREAAEYRRNRLARQHRAATGGKARRGGRLAARLSGVLPSHRAA